MIIVHGSRMTTYSVEANELHISNIVSILKKGLEKDSDRYTTDSSSTKTLFIVVGKSRIDFRVLDIKETDNKEVDIRIFVDAAYTYDSLDNYSLKDVVKYLIYNTTTTFYGKNNINLYIRMGGIETTLEIHKVTITY